MSQKLLNNFLKGSTRRVFLKQIGIGAAGVGFMAALPHDYYSDATNKRALPRSTPEQQGVSSTRISAFLDEVEKSKIEFHSVMVLRHGHVIAEGWWAPYAAPLKHTLYSLSKSFTSTAVGLAIAEGHFTLESSVLSFFPNEVPQELNDNLSAMKVKHLLTMSTGHVKDTIQPMRKSSEHWVKTFLSLPVDREPGTFFLYNTGATYTLSAIIHKVTGQTLLQYLQSRLFDPLGIVGEDWESDPQGINTGGYGLRIKTEDIAKFGQLYLQKGKWGDKQILPPKWIEEATRTQIASNSSNPTRPKEEDDWAQGYGYQFWRCRPGGYRADGAFGQFCMVMPEYDAVVAVTSESFSMQTSMDLIWSYLLPAMDKTKSTLPGDSKSRTQLQQKLKQLALSPPKKNPSSPIASIISGKEFILDANDFKAKSIVLDFRGNVCVFTLKDEKGQHQITCGINGWNEQKNEKKGTPFPVAGQMEVPTAIAASATWEDDKVLTMTWRLIESAHTNGLIYVFDEGRVTIKFFSSISLANPKAPEKRRDLTGSFT
jgi:CubicO group peptidase (beta-lactamase class C family)